MKRTEREGGRMKKALVVWGTGIVFILTLLVSLAYGVDKFASVDIIRIASEYNKAKDYQKNLENKINVYNTQRDEKVNDIKQFQDKMNLLSDKEKEAKQAELEAKVKALQDFDREQQTDLRKEDLELNQKIAEDIKRVIEQYAQKQGYTLVFDARVLAYQTKGIDITDKIIQTLNKDYKK